LARAGATSPAAPRPSHPARPDGNGFRPDAALVPILYGGGLRRAGAVALGRAVYNVLGKRAGQADPAHLSPPDLQDAGADVALVQRLAGHAAVGTTPHYDRPDHARQKAAETLPVPFVEPGA
jgi:site-specific recombinase XerD